MSARKINNIELNEISIDSDMPPMRHWHGWAEVLWRLEALAWLAGLWF